MSKQFDLTGKKFRRLTVLQRNGTSRVRHIRWLCLCDCGKHITVDSISLRSGHTSSCGCLKLELQRKRRGSLNPNWKGGRHIDDKGYVRVKNVNYPMKRAFYALEHVVIMATHLGRPLLPHENVHHKNGIRDDNRIENLELWTTKQPSGQRVKDLVSWAREILAIYP